MVTLEKFKYIVGSGMYAQLMPQIQHTRFNFVH